MQLKISPVEEMHRAKYRKCHRISISSLGVPPFQNLHELANVEVLPIIFRVMEA